LQPPSFLVSIEYNVKDPNILAGGCYNGQVRQKDRKTERQTDKKTRRRKDRKTERHRDIET
jgi:hypothetical protein